MPAQAISVYVSALPGAPDFGDTTITLPEVDEDRADFLMSCRNFFIDRQRPADAEKFYDAVAQTPST